MCIHYYVNGSQLNVDLAEMWSTNFMGIVTYVRKLNYSHQLEVLIHTKYM